MSKRMIEKRLQTTGDDRKMSSCHRMMSTRALLNACRSESDAISSREVLEIRSNDGRLVMAIERVT